LGLTGSLEEASMANRGSCMYVVSAAGGTYFCRYSCGFRKNVCKDACAL
jgi:hypothetical protein